MPSRSLPLLVESCARTVQGTVLPAWRPQSATRRRFGTSFRFLGDVGWTAAALLAIPFAILATGIPIALAVRLAVWLGAWLLHAIR